MDADGGASGGKSDRVGFALFWVYVLLYFGFIVAVVFRPDLLASRPLGGVNLAITWGLGLIGAALLLAAVSTVTGRGDGPRGGDTH